MVDMSKASLLVPALISHTMESRFLPYSWSFGFSARFFLLWSLWLWSFSQVDRHYFSTSKCCGYLLHQSSKRLFSPDWEPSGACSDCNRQEFCWKCWIQSIFRNFWRFWTQIPDLEAGHLGFLHPSGIFCPILLWFENVCEFEHVFILQTRAKVCIFKSHLGFSYLDSGRRCLVHPSDCEAYIFKFGDYWFQIDWDSIQWVANSPELDFVSQCFLPFSVRPFAFSPSAGQDRGEFKAFRSQDPERVGSWNFDQVESKLGAMAYHVLLAL